MGACMFWVVQGRWWNCNATTQTRGGRKKRRRIATAVSVSGQRRWARGGPTSARFSYSPLPEKIAPSSTPSTMETPALSWNPPPVIRRRPLTLSSTLLAPLPFTPALSCASELQILIFLLLFYSLQATSLNNFVFLLSLICYYICCSLLLFNLYMISNEGMMQNTPLT